jgi:hypothetical protein
MRARTDRGRTSPWTTGELRILDRLRSPASIQAFLDDIPYSDDPIYRCPRSVMRDRKAHCMDGAVFAAAALDHIGLAPKLVDMRAVRDDDHVIAIYEVRGRLGAVAKSNFTTLRFREPVYRSLRELVMSFFDFYYNVAAEKTLRAYSVPLAAASLAELEWRTSDEAMEVIAARLDRLRHVPLLTAAMVRRLGPVDRRTYEAGLAGANPAGLYRPPAKG